MTERIDTKGKTMWAPVRNWKDHRTDVQARRLVHERESLLSGRYAFELQSRRIPVSPWAWVSALAHSSRDQLVELSANVRPRSWRPHDPAARWQAAAAFLAMELLTTAELMTVLHRQGFETVAEVDRCILQPLFCPSSSERSVRQRVRLGSSRPSSSEAYGEQSLAFETVHTHNETIGVAAEGSGGGHCSSTP